MKDTSTIDFSAQYGGPDARQSVLPDFRALKRAAVGVEFAGFPASSLSFMLRVDGEFQSFTASGSEHIDVDRNGEYISVDIGVSLADRERLDSRSKPNPISEALMASVEMLRNSDRKRLADIDFDALGIAVQSLCRRYEEEVRTAERPSRDAKDQA